MLKFARSDEPKVNQVQIKSKVQMTDKEMIKHLVICH